MTGAGWRDVEIICTLCLRPQIIIRSDRREWRAAAWLILFACLAVHSSLDGNEMRMVVDRMTDPIESLALLSAWNKELA